MPGGARPRHRYDHPMPAQHDSDTHAPDLHAHDAHADDIAALHARFEALVLPHLDRMLGFARRRVREADDAEDAVQECCVRAWGAFEELRDAAKARAWLYQILRGVLSDARDKEGRRRQLVDITRLEDAHAELVGGDRDPVFAELMTRLSSELVHEALGMIPEDFATAVELHDIDGFKYHEIAEIAGVPIGTVMSRISRGRKLLAGAVTVSQAARVRGGAPSASASPSFRDATPRRST